MSETLAGALTRVLEASEVAALVTIVSVDASVPGRVGAKVLFDARGHVLAGGSGDARLDTLLAAHAARNFLPSRAEARTYNLEELSGEVGDAAQAWAGARFLFERVEPEPRLVVCGAGHVGASLARLAHALNYRVTLIDDRADFVLRERFPKETISLVCAEDGWARAVREAVGGGRGVAVAVVTRGHNEDEEALLSALGTRPDYVGMIGSRRRTNIVLGRLREAGVAESSLSEVRAPVGLDIGAVTPEEVALCILAEIVAHRRGGTGAPLSAWRRAAP